MSSPFFSVVIAAYNAENYLDAAIKSVLSQTFADFELLVVNDGSTDRTREIIEEFSARDSRVFLLEKTEDGRSVNAGPSSARNLGLDRAQGEYLYIMDADDLLEPDLLAVFKEHIRQSGCDLAVCGYNMITVWDGKQHADLFSEQAFTASTQRAFLERLPLLMARQLMYVTWNKVYRRSLVEEHSIRFREYRSCEDRIFNLDVFSHVQNFVFESRPLYQYYNRSKQGLNSKYLENRLESLNVFQNKLTELFREHNLLTEENQSIFSQFYVKGILACLVSLYHPSCPLSKAQKNEYVDRLLQTPSVHQAARCCKSGGLGPRATALVLRTRWRWLNKLTAKTAYTLSNKASGLFMKLKYGK